MFEGFAWLIPLWAVHITAFLGTGLAVICWCKAVAVTNRESPGALWPFTFAVLTNLGFVVGVWVVVGRRHFRQRFWGLALRDFFFAFASF